MKHLLNTLYVSTPGAYLARDGETVAIRIEHETRLRVPIHTLGSIVCFDQIACSPPLLGLCAENGVAVSFLSRNGRFMARVEGPVSGNVLLRRAQYHLTDDTDASAAIARAVVLGKITNARSIMLRGAREARDDTASNILTAVQRELARILDEVKRAQSVETIRGKEGEAARVYFGGFDALIAPDNPAFRFCRRSRRPPLDNVNALLSFLYTLLVHDVRSALECVGLDTAVGFLHRERPGRPSLALDLMEELRACVADRLALSLINRRQVQAKGFVTTDTGAVQMDDDTRKTVLVAYQNRKQDEILHPFINEQIAIGLIPHVQATLLARHIRGDLDGYPPFFWR